jgi:hypothetical protein
MEAMLYSPCLLGRMDLAKMNNSTLNTQYTVAITVLYPIFKYKLGLSQFLHSSDRSHSL